jgi:hypothetical protein
MSVRVPLGELRDELDGRANTGYLLTVGDDGRPHCVGVRLRWQGDELVMGSGTTSLRNARARRHVTLLSPPGPPGAGSSEPGYALIVDGDVAATSPPDDDGGGTVRVRPTHAVLHRPAASADGGHGHDCVHLVDRTAPPA